MPVSIGQGDRPQKNGITFDLQQTIRWLEAQIVRAQAHGSNILTKLRQFGRLSLHQQQGLQDVVSAYREWMETNRALHGYTADVIRARVQALNRYKISIEGAPFTPQSKFHSSVLEEFLYYLFRDLLAELNTRSREEIERSKPMEIGGTRAYSNLYFAPENIRTFALSPRMRINEKDQDFAIYREVRVEVDGESRTINVPVVSIECKTYIDKTMLEGSIATAEKIKMGNPHCLFIVVTEWYDVSYEVDPKYSRIDQIYVLRREKRKSAESSPVDSEVVIDLSKFVCTHLQRDWSRIEEKMRTEGKIL